MTTPPYVSPDQMAEAVRSIAARRADIDDPHRERLGEDPRETLSYLRKFSNPRQVPDWVQVADILDALTIRLGLWWEGEETEAWALGRAQALGIPRRDVGVVLGIGTGQGVVDRQKASRRRLARHRPDTRLEQTTERQTTPAVSPAQAWLAGHQPAVHTVAAALLAARELASDDDELADHLVEVARDARAGRYTTSSMLFLDEVVSALELMPAVTGRPADDPLRAALASWAGLRQDFWATVRAGRLAPKHGDE